MFTNYSQMVQPKWKFVYVCLYIGEKKESKHDLFWQLVNLGERGVFTVFSQFFCRFEISLEIDKSNNWSPAPCLFHSFFSLFPPFRLIIPSVQREWLNLLSLCEHIRLACLGYLLCGQIKGGASPLPGFMHNA